MTETTPTQTPQIIKPNWTKIAELQVSAQPSDGGIWQCACQYVQGPALLKIEAGGEWSYSTALTKGCSPNGDLGSALEPKNCVHEKSPVGALIGRIGGGISDKDATSVFSVGTLCIRKLTTEVGPLFLAINDMWNGFGDNNGSLTVTVSLAEDVVKRTTVA